MFERFKQWRQARLRGEKRIAPYGVTGRVYQKVDPNSVVTDAGAEHTFEKTAHVSVTARVVRADGSTEEL